MTRKFKVGDKIKLNARRAGYDKWHWIYKDKFKIGTVIGFEGAYDGFEDLPRVKWEDREGFSHLWDFFYPSEDLDYFSIVYLEDHLKDKDIL